MAASESRAFSGLSGGSGYAEELSRNEQGPTLIIRRLGLFNPEKRIRLIQVNVGYLTYRDSGAEETRFHLQLQTTEKGRTMPSIPHTFRFPSALTRSVAVAALLGATMLAGSLTAARAETAAIAPIQLAQATAPQSAAGAGATEAKTETVEQRITALHAALKITPDEEKKWASVAQAMRQNAAAMDKLVAQTDAKSAKPMTAVDDLKTYQKFAQAHVNGLKNLIDDFQALYAAMPDAQKKNADEVFKTSEQ